MNLTTERWSEIAGHLDYDTDVYRPEGEGWNGPWRRVSHDTLRRPVGMDITWRPDSDDEVRIEVPSVEEPKDGSRIEFTYGSDVYGAWRDDRDSVKTGWRSDQGWCLYGESVPCSWAVMWLRFGESLGDAVQLERVR